MIISKQRAYLRALANGLETILIVGKGGVSADVIKQADEALTAREIFKGKVLESAKEKAREVATILAEATTSKIVQVIGTKFVLYRKNEKKPKINLPKGRLCD